ncbi:MAG: hypothetical protein IKG86_00815 [Paludibacteraceae bacterium]|nr:hypothetical protein [Paludibacteraceae bacterium]
MKKVFLSMLTLICSLSMMATQTAYVQMQLVGTSYPTFSTSNLYLTEDTERNATYESGYDSYCEGTLSNSYSVLLYAFVGSDKCSSVATNDLRGLQIGFKTNNVDTDYKLKFSDFDGLEFYLYDRVLHKMTLINSTTPDYSFTAASGQIEVNDRFVINTVAIVGTNNEPYEYWWETEYNSVLTIAANGETATGTITFPAGKVGAWYNFKVLGRTGSNWYSNAAEFTSTNNSQVVSGTETGNMYFEIAQAGDYTFTWTFATNTLEITFPAVAPANTVTTNSNGFLSFASTEDVEFLGGLKAYRGQYNAGTNELTLYEIGTKVPANTGVILWNSNGTAETFNYTTGADVSGVTVGTNNFVGVTTAADPAGIRAAGKEIYCLNGNALKQYVGTDDIPAGKAYLPISVGGGSNNAPKHITMRFNNTTAVDNLDVEAGNVEKFIENGQIYIRRGNEVFNMQGQIVK